MFKLSNISQQVSFFTIFQFVFVYRHQSLTVRALHYFAAKKKKIKQTNSEILFLYEMIISENQTAKMRETMSVTQFTL